MFHSHFHGLVVKALLLLNLLCSVGPRKLAALDLTRLEVGLCISKGRTLKGFDGNGQIPRDLTER